MNLFIEIFRKYGIEAIVTVILIAFFIWGLEHWAASPGTEVSVLWGLVKYTKSPEDHTIHEENKTASVHIDNIKPSIMLFNDITSEMDSIGTVDKEHAPQRVRVKGVASNAMNYYVYVIVNDDIAEWIEPVTGLGAHVDNNFSGECFLGESRNKAYRNKLYKVYAVITNREYQKYNHLDRKTVIAQSNEIELFRTK
jgi:hypothetical protein